MIRRSTTPLIMVLLAAALGAGAAAAVAVGAEGLTAIGQNGQDGCSLAGIFAATDVSGTVDMTRLYDLPHRLRLRRESADAGVAVAAYRQGGLDYVDITLDLEVVDDDAGRVCALATVPGATVSALPVAAGELDFQSAIPGLSTPVAAAGPLDLFGHHQWVGVSLYGARAFSRLGEGDPGRLFSTILRGLVQWTVVAPDGSEAVVRATWAPSADDDAAIMRAVRAALAY
jgi:hypothetical protein